MSGFAGAVGKPSLPGDSDLGDASVDRADDGPSAFGTQPDVTDPISPTTRSPKRPLTTTGYALIGRIFMFLNETTPWSPWIAMRPFLVLAKPGKALNLLLATRAQKSGLSITYS